MVDHEKKTSSCWICCVFRLIPESPRWLLLKGHLRECRVVLEYIAMVNKRELPQELELRDIEVVWKAFLLLLLLKCGICIVLHCFCQELLLGGFL